MTQARATKRRTTLEKNATAVIAELVDGKTQYEVAKHFSVHYSSVMRFVDRHAQEIEELRARIAKEAEEYTIAAKVNRIAALDDRWQRMKRLIDARAQDDRYSNEPGYETGLMFHQLKAVGRGDDFQLVDLYVTDAGLLAEMRATERAAADELGQMPKGEEQGTTVAVQVVLNWGNDDNA